MIVKQALARLLTVTGAIAQQPLAGLINSGWDYPSTVTVPIDQQSLV